MSLPGYLLRRLSSKKILGILIFGEIFLFGSGQILLIFDGLSLKMFNFSVMLIMGCYFIFRHRQISKELLQLLYFFLFSISLAILLGTINGGLEYMFFDISPLSYFFALIFFDIYIRNVSDINFVISLLKFSALFMAILYLVYLGMIYWGLLDFNVTYMFLENQSDILFRGNEGAFFYKGFLYLVIGLIFYIVEGEMFTWKGVILLLAIYFTHTRAFLIITLCSCLFCAIYWMHFRNYILPMRNIFLFIVLLLGFFLVVPYVYDSFVEVDRSGGDAIRLQTIDEVFERVTLCSVFVGHGLGVGVPIRMVHMEMSFLEIFHKQGFLGLLFWTYVIIKGYLYFINTHRNFRRSALPFLISISMIYIQSLFNPYLNNPIGMSFVIISYVSLKVICEESRRSDLADL